MTRARSRRKAEQAVVRAADVLTNYMIGKKVEWVGLFGARYCVPPHRMRPLMNACAALIRLRKAKR